MRLSRKSKMFRLFALMFVMGAFLVMGTTAAYAAAPEQAETSAEPAAELSIEPGADESVEPVTPQNIEDISEQDGDALLIVREVWLTGDLLNISVTDSLGENQTLELNLRDYAKPGDEYVTVQATDSAGHTSNAIQFKNPYYTASAEPSAEDGESKYSGTDSPKPFTPAGNGTVIDDATDGDGKEFFTVDTPDGNTFYLIVDRQRGTDNVYLLDAVSENDLASLAKPGDGKTAVEPPPTQAPAITAPPETAPEPAPVTANNNMGVIAFAVVTLIVVGGIAYYFKIVRPKKNGADDYAADGFDDDTEADLGGEDGEDA